MSNSMANSGLRRWGLGMALCVWLAGCGDQGPDSILPSTSAIIYGTVADAETMVPVANIDLDISVLTTSCNYQTGFKAVATSGPDGAYRAKILTPMGAFTACMSVSAVAPSGAEIVYGGSMLQFLPDAGPDRDSIQVDVYLP